jgi:DNA-binding CsgD family transcriptional regulator
MPMCFGKSLEEIATERSVKITTVRTRLARLFARAGAESQRDLVRLIALLPPLRGH